MNLLDAIVARSSLMNLCPSSFLFAFVPVSCLNSLAGAIIIHGFVVCDRPAFLFDIFILICFNIFAGFAIIATITSLQVSGFLFAIFVLSCFNIFAGCYIIHDLDLVMTCL